MFDCSIVRLFPPRFEDDLAIVDLVIRVVILFNFQLPVFKDQASALSGERVHSISLFQGHAQGGI